MKAHVITRDGYVALELSEAPDRVILRQLLSDQVAVWVGDVLFAPGQIVSIELEDAA